MENQLIILGNGFDLAAGLKSSYQDFYNDYFKEYNKKAEEMKKENEVISDTKIRMFESGEFKDENFWLKLLWILFYCKGNSRWADVEYIIFEVVGIFNKRGLYGLNRKTEKDFPSSLQEIKDNHVKYLLHEMCGLSRFRGEWLFSQSGKEKVQTIFRDILFDDLRKFEKIFADYLNKKIEANYCQKSNNEIILLSEEDTGNSEFQSQVLSFNYTNTIDDTVKEENNIKKVINVHGNVKNNNIIMGIDGHLFNEDKKVSENIPNWIAPFTKTYRILENQSDGLELNNNFQVIKFFGHSLAEADYSYFQTIFDDVNLYNSETRLIFYYYIYDDEKSQEIKLREMKRVYKLINKYGETLDNKDHGKNLLHKLMLEGRLKIKEINL